METKKHWDEVYATKNPDQVSWTQVVPQTSLNAIQKLNLPKTAKIIDIGGGDSNLVDFLLAQGFQHITVLDISENALAKAKLRLGKMAEKVNWIVSDITEFEPTTTYDLWHDRATFHFLTNAHQVAKYHAIVNQTVNGFLIIGTFSTKGPLKCSGLEIKQYDEEKLSNVFNNNFNKIACETVDHITPFNTTQQFLFCNFKKK
jgi:hypothetical protein